MNIKRKDLRNLHFAALRDTVIYRVKYIVFYGEVNRKNIPL